MPAGYEYRVDLGIMQDVVYRRCAECKAKTLGNPFRCRAGSSHHALTGNVSVATGNIWQKMALGVAAGPYECHGYSCCRTHLSNSDHVSVNHLLGIVFDYNT